MLTSTELELLTDLRRELHCNPELSGKEYETAARIKSFIARHAPADGIVEGLGGTGLAFIYNSSAPQTGKTVLIRAELDGLPIAEQNDGLGHRSCCAGKSHLCGHDGHMAIVAAVAVRLAKERPENGRVVLLFQPAEETGRGMKSVIADAKFAAIKPDVALALHNIPGLPLGHVSTKDGPFSSSVESLIFRLEGMTSHAAEPEKAVNPVVVVAETLHYLDALNKGEDDSPDFVRASVTYVRLGEPDSHGVTAGGGQVNVTVRARTPRKLEEVKMGMQAFFAERIAAYNASLPDPTQGLVLGMEITEPFEANVNHPDAVALIRKAAAVTDTPFIAQKTPNSWGEDNGALTNLEGVKGAMFGLGSGIDQPPLHNRNFDFPDALIEKGSALFIEAAREVWRQEKKHGGAG